MLDSLYNDTNGPAWQSQQGWIASGRGGPGPCLTNRSMAWFGVECAGTFPDSIMCVGWLWGED